MYISKKGILNCFIFSFEMKWRLISYRIRLKHFRFGNRSNGRRHWSWRRTLSRQNPWKPCQEDTSRGLSTYQPTHAPLDIISRFPNQYIQFRSCSLISPSLFQWNISVASQMLLLQSTIISSYHLNVSILITDIAFWFF